MKIPILTTVLASMAASSLLVQCASLSFSNGSFERGLEDWTAYGIGEQPRIVFDYASSGSASVVLPPGSGVTQDFTIPALSLWTLTFDARDPSAPPGTPAKARDGLRVQPGFEWTHYSFDLWLPRGTFGIGVEADPAGWLQLDNFGCVIPEPGATYAFAAGLCAFVAVRSRRRL